MVAETKFFGKVDIDEDKVLEFSNGIIGFDQCTKYAIIYDSENDKKSSISWLQSLDEPLLVLPVVDPLSILNEYNPIIEDELLKPLGNPEGDDLLVLVALTVPSDLTKMTANLKAPFIINSKTKRGAQIIVDNAEYEIKFNVYEAIEKLKEKVGE